MVQVPVVYDYFMMFATGAEIFSSKRNGKTIHCKKEYRTSHKIPRFFFKVSIAEISFLSRVPC